MRPSAQKGARSVRETLHVLTNALAAARMWLVVLNNTPPGEREPKMDELLDRLHRSIGDAEKAVHELRRQPGRAPTRRRK